MLVISKLSKSLLFALLSTNAIAYDQQRALDNYAEEISACTSYYALVISNSNLNAENQNDDRWRQVAKNYEITFNNSLSLLRIAMAGKSDTLIQSKLDLRQKEQLKIIDTEGMDRLIFLFSDSCKDLLEHSDKHLQYWLEK